MMGVGQMNAEIFVSHLSPQELGPPGYLMRFWFGILFIFNSVRAKTKQFHLKQEGSHTALTQNNSRPKLNNPKCFGYYFLCNKPAFSKPQELKL